MVQAGKKPLTETILDEPVLPALARPGSRQRAGVMQAQVADGPGKGTPH
jgi:hypothetical protein